MHRLNTIFRLLGRMSSSSPARSIHSYRTIVVEGNIASGKTSFLEYFGKFANVKVFAEPVDKWRNLDGNNLLDLLYRNPSRWSFAFQMYADLSRLCLHQSNETLKPGDTKLIERSLFSGKYCFAENAFRSGNINPVEYAILNHYFQWMTTNRCETLHVDLIVYLRTTPEVCYQRLRKRCREEELDIPLEYLVKLHDLYEEWLIQKLHPVPAELLVLDANDDLPAMFSIYDRHAENILSAPVGKKETTH